MGFVDLCDALDPQVSVILNLSGHILVNHAALLPFNNIVHRSYHVVQRSEALLLLNSPFDRGFWRRHPIRDTVGRAALLTLSRSDLVFVIGVFDKR